MTKSHGTVCPAGGAAEPEASRWQRLEGHVHQKEEGQRTGRGGPGQGFVGLRTESGFGFMHNEKPLEGAKEKQNVT